MPEAPAAPTTMRASSTAAVRSPNPSSAQVREPPMRQASPRQGAMERQVAVGGDVPVPSDLDTKPDPGRVAALKSMIDPDEPKPGTAPAKPAEPKPEDPPRPGLAEEPPANPDDAAKPAETPTAGAKPADAPPDKRKNPWKLLDEEKKVRGTLEAEVQRLKSERVPEQERTELMSRVEKAEARAKEVEEHLRFRDYEESTDFQEKYHQPYVDRLGEAMQFLSRIPITDPVTLQQRAATEHDLFEIMALDPVAAQDRAEEKFGKLARRVISLADTVQTAWSSRTKALETEKKNGALRVKQQQEAFQRAMESTHKSIVQEATSVYNEMLASQDKELVESFQPFPIAQGKEPTPAEKAHNDAVTTATQLFDKFWRAEPAKAKSPEERKAIIATHLKIRQQAIGFEPMRLAMNYWRGKAKELEKELGGYERTAPQPPGDQPRTPARAGEPDVLDEFEQNLRRRSTMH